MITKEATIPKINEIKNNVDSIFKFFEEYTIIVFLAPISTNADAVPTIPIK